MLEELPRELADVLLHVPGQLKQPGEVGWFVVRPFVPAQVREYERKPTELRPLPASRRRVQRPRLLVLQSAWPHGALRPNPLEQRAPEIEAKVQRLQERIHIAGGA
tara:strand:- start:83 stop:400 length:318 start_codon:yes stop_codon:yes gene_type:complete